MPEQTHRQLEALGISVDRTPYTLSFEETVAYLAEKIPAYDLVMASQAVPDLYPALERLPNPPPLIEHGGLVSEAGGPKHLTARYVGVCASIRDAAAAHMPGRPHHALEIPSMVDLSEFHPEERGSVRHEWGMDEETVVIGWAGRLDRKKRVEDFIHAAALLHQIHPYVRYVVIGGPDAFMPDYAGHLHALANTLGLASSLTFLGDRDDVPRLLSGLDAFAWLSRGEGMPHVIAEAGAASLPVVATRDNGSEQQITDGETGLFVPHESPRAVAAALQRLVEQPDLRHYLGQNLRRKVEQEYSATAIAQRWQSLWDEVISESCLPVSTLPPSHLAGRGS